MGVRQAEERAAVKTRGEGVVPHPGVHPPGPSSGGTLRSTQGLQDADPAEPPGGQWVPDKESRRRT